MIGNEVKTRTPPRLDRGFIILATASELTAKMRHAQRGQCGQCFAKAQPEGWTYQGVEGGSVVAQSGGGDRVAGVRLLTNGGDAIGDPLIIVRDGSSVLGIGRNRSDGGTARFGRRTGTRGEIIVDELEPPPEEEPPPPTQGGAFTRGTWLLPVGGGSGSTAYSSATISPSEGGNPDNPIPFTGNYADEIPSFQRTRQISSEFVINGGTRARSLILNAPGGQFINAGQIASWTGDRTTAQLQAHPGQELVDLYRQGFDTFSALAGGGGVGHQFARSGTRLFGFGVQSGDIALQFRNPQNAWVPLATSPLSTDPFGWLIAANRDELVLVEGSNFDFNDFAIHRSEDEGATWTTSTLAPLLISGQALAIAPGPANNWAISTGQQGAPPSVLISTNGGTTWEDRPPPITTGDPITSVAWSGDRLLAATATQLWARTGAAWAQLTIPVVPDTNIISLSTGGNEVLIVRHNYTAIRSIDGGVNWTNLTLA